MRPNLIVVAVSCQFVSDASHYKSSYWCDRGWHDCGLLLEGTLKSRQSQAGTRQGQAGTNRDKAGTSRDKQRYSEDHQEQ